MIVALIQQEKTKGCSIFATRFKVNVVFFFFFFFLVPFFYSNLGGKELLKLAVHQIFIDSFVDVWNINPLVLKINVALFIDSLSLGSLSDYF